MRSVSLCMIARDEAANISPAVEPLVGLIDDLVVVDTGSRDNTPEVARRLGARVFDLPWCDDFSAARNEALRHARGDWVFVLDADDRLLPSERQKMGALLEALPDENVAYFMQCVCLASDGGIGTGVEQVRLFRKTPAARWQYRVHEEVLPSILAAGGRTVRTSVRILHTGYRNDEDVERKIERNFRLIEAERVERPHDPHVLLYRGALLLDMKRADEALVSLILCRSLLAPGTDALRHLFGLLARAFDATGRQSEALETVREARAAFPDDPELAHAEAQALVRLGELAGAALILARVTADGSLPTVRSRTLLGEIHLSLHHWDAAEETARALLRERPSFGAAWFLLADALLGQRNFDELERLLAELARVRGSELASAMIRAARSAARGDVANPSAVDTSKDQFLPRFRERLAAGRSVPPLVSCLSPAWG